MRRKLIVGNWKMHGTMEQVQELLIAVVDGSEQLAQTTAVAICPTALHLHMASLLLESSSVKLGAQNVHSASEGAFTGEVSAQMLVEYGLTYVIVGHSERREIFAESDQFIAEKFKAVQASGMIPILCVGETLAQRQQNISDQVVLAQLDAVIEAAGIAAFDNAVIAYEPIWAIGTGETATPEQAQEIHRTLREHMRKLDEKIADKVQILYGGSVKSSNAKELFGQADIDGGLVGGASLKADEFISICKSAD